jgi:4-amino-4-deoxy-L-arabinose transferase-like glycosyltransferase
MSTPAERRRPWFTAAAVAALLVLHAGLALWAAAKESVTADEILHVTGGYFYNRFGDYRIHPENGNLPQRWAALPAVLLGTKPPPLADNPYWRTSDASVVGHQLFYETGQDHWPMLLAGRAMITLFSMGTGLLVFLWARRLGGDAAGFFALGLFAFDPNLLAHAALTTSDTAAVFFLLAASGAFWRHLAQPTWRTGALSAVVFGFACVAKYSAVLLLPVMAALLAWRVTAAPVAECRRWWRLAPLTLASHAVAAVFVIWLFFGFRYSGFAPGLPAADHYTVPWETLLPLLGWQGRVVQLCREWQLLPEAFLYGYGWVVQSAQTRSAFLAGDYSVLGWISFFPLAFLWKTPLALLVALVLGFAIVIRRWTSAGASIAADLTRIAPLLVLLGVYWAFSLSSHLNIGHRHILPTYPVLYILVGLLATTGLAARWRQGVVIALLLAGQLAANVRVAPHYLAFFNSLAGGPANGWRLLVDSSLDWGQDLPGLARWLREHNDGGAAQPAYLAYFGSGDPDYYGIRATRLPFVNGFKFTHHWYEPAAGIYCVSATMLQQVYSPVRGPWTVAFEQEYQLERLKEGLFREYWTNAATRDAVQASGAAKAFEETWQRYDLLRFARLCHYLRVRRPEAVVGHSIFIYRLSAAEVNAVLRGTYSEWLHALEQAGRN